MMLLLTQKSWLLHGPIYFFISVIFFTGNLDIFSFGLYEGHCQYHRIDSDTEKYGSFDIKHIMMSQLQTITSVLKITTYTDITARPNEHAEILVIMSVSTFNTAVILYI